MISGNCILGTCCQNRRKCSLAKMVETVWIRTVQNMQNLWISKSWPSVAKMEIDTADNGPLRRNSTRFSSDFRVRLAANAATQPENVRECRHETGATTYFYNKERRGLKRKHCAVRFRYASGGRGQRLSTSTSFAAMKKKKKNISIDFRQSLDTFYI